MERRKATSGHLGVTVTGIVCQTAREAVELVERKKAAHACTIGNCYMAISEKELRKLQEEGISPTTWHRSFINGERRIVSVPGNE